MRQARACFERKRGAPVDDAIEIVALQRGEAGVERGRHGLGRQHRDRMRTQMRVDRIAHGVGVPLPREIEMGDLSERMHARIGAARPAHRDGLAAEGGDRRLERRPGPTTPFSCTCQPTKGAPSYSITSL